MNKNDILTFTWQAHQSQENWSGKADIKGSILLAADAAVLASIVTVGSTGLHLLSLLWIFSITSLTLSAVLAGFSIKPALKSNTRRTSTDLVFFGHIKDMDSHQLSMEISGLTFDKAIEGLSMQLVNMSKGNWKKHRLLVASTWFAIAAVPLTVAAVLFA